MNPSPRHTRVALGSLLALTSLAACGTPHRATLTTSQTPSHTTADTFPAPRGDLTITSEFGRVHVHRHTSHTIVVQRHLAKVGLNASEPDWTFKGNTLNLGTGCGDGFVGFCKPSYDITVPTETKVHLKNTSEEN